MFHHPTATCIIFLQLQKSKSPEVPHIDIFSVDSNIVYYKYFPQLSQPPCSLTNTYGIFLWHYYYINSSDVPCAESTVFK